MQKIKSVVDELAMLGTHISPEDVTDIITEGLQDPSYQHVIDAVNARDTPISFPELHEKLINRELTIQVSNPTPSPTFPAVAHATSTRQQSHKTHQSARTYNSVPNPTTNQNPSNPFRGRCQWCNVQFHTLAFCPTFKALYPDIKVPRYTKPTAQANLTTLTTTDTPWLLDSGASHHVTSDLANLSLHYPYDGTDEIVIGDGTSLPISHTGSVSFSLPHSTVSLTNVLCVPLMHKNIISISQLCRDNNLCVEFSHTSFSLKDRTLGVVLLTGPGNDGVYYWPSSSSQSPAQAHATSLVGTDLHHRFGHPSPSILKQLLSSFRSSSLSTAPCNSCSIYKSHKLPFSESSLSTNAPLEVVFSDVWSSPILSFDNFKYYVIFVDHFTKYTWLYSIKNKSDTSQVFIYFKALVEKKFSRPILTLYSDNGGEYTKMRSYLASNGISHLTSPPHTPEHNGYAERRHRHIVETGLNILSHASLPLIYWPYAFQTSTYLINRLPTPTLAHKSPYQVLFGTIPKYANFHNFGCLCYPWLRPYTDHKLDPRSIACVFIGYSPTQHSYLCLDPKTNCIYSSRHVRFFDSTYPFKSSASSISESSTTTSSWCDFSIPTIASQPFPPAPDSSTVSPTSSTSSAFVLPTDTASPIAITTDSAPSPPPANPSPLNSPVAAPIHPYATRASHNIHKPVRKLNLSYTI